MKHTKLFEGFINEGGPQDCASELCGMLMPTVDKITNLISHYSIPQDLIKLQAEIAKLQKTVADTIRNSAKGATEELNWDRAPLAPIFVLNLKQRYPQNEARYYALWYKAAERLPSFNYGGAIQIFKTYCKREDLMLEEHDYGYDESTEISEGE